MPVAFLSLCLEKGLNYNNIPNTGPHKILQLQCSESHMLMMQVVRGETRPVTGTG